jgi:outer membrane protein assembly factor BamB
MLYSRLVGGRRLAATSLALAASVCASLVWGAACRRDGGRAASPATTNAATVLWSIELGTAGSPWDLAIAPDGTVYVAGFDEPESPPPGYASAEGFRRVCLYAIDAQGNVTRKLAGSVTRDRPAVWVLASPWGAGLAVDALGGLYGLLAGGRERFNPSGLRVAGPAALSHRGQLLVGGPGGVTALELESDEPASLFLSTGTGYATAPTVAADGTLYFGTSRRMIAASAGGDLLWEIKAGMARPTLGPGDRLYVTSGQKLSAFATNGEALWEFEAETPLGTPPAPAPDGSVYVATASGLLYSIERGQKRWSFPLEREVRSHLSVAPSGTVYAADVGGKLYAIGTDGRRRWAFQLPMPTGTPIPGPDGTLYVTDVQGRLRAVAPPAPGD